MFDYPIDKYHFYSTTNKVIAVSTYAGKTVRGIAACDPRDQFNMEQGRLLAAARCNQKIAQKRKARADRELKKALAAYDKAEQHLAAMNNYYEDARTAVKNANMRVNNLLATM